MQGKSLLTSNKRQFVISEGQYGTEGNSCIGYMIHTERFKMLVRGSMENSMLFDLEKDPFELNNCVNSPEYQRERNELQNMLSNFIIFDSLGSVYRDRKAPQLRNQSVLDTQAKQMKEFIKASW